jgi:hypothetical protein
MINALYLVYRQILLNLPRDDIILKPFKFILRIVSLFSGGGKKIQNFDEILLNFFSKTNHQILPILNFLRGELNQKKIMAILATINNY